MNTSASILVLTLAIGTWSVADLPKKAPYSKYAGLVQNSPFTSKPPPPGPAEVADPLEDYALSGVSPIGGGYRVTLLNKKKPDERISITTGEVKPTHGFKILEVKRKDGDPLGTTVVLSSGSGTGTVAFEEKLLTLAAAPAARPPGAPNPGAAPNPQTGAPNLPGQAPRQARPRVILPPTPVAPAAPAAGAQAAPFVPGGQQQRSSGNRYDHRGSSGRR